MPFRTCLLSKTINTSNPMTHRRFLGESVIFEITFLLYQHNKASQLISLVKSRLFLAVAK